MCGRGEEVCWEKVVLNTGVAVKIFTTNKKAQIFTETHYY